jgi:hypothetical protein
LRDFNRGCLRPHPSTLEPPVGSGPFQLHSLAVSSTYGRGPRWYFNQRHTLLADEWQRTDEHLPMSHIAEVTHSRGLIWDQISVESSGGLNPFVIPGLPKGQARYFVERVRERLNETGANRLDKQAPRPG